MNHSYRMLLEHFQSYLSAQNVSSRTVKDYPPYVAKFLDYLEKQEDIEDICEVTTHHFRNYHFSLMEIVYRGKPLSVSTMHTRLGIVKTFFRFLHITERVYHDPLANYPLPKKRKGLPKNVLEIWEMRKLLEQPDSSTLYGCRDLAMLELLYSTGIRNEEIRSLELNSLDLQACTIRLRGKGNIEAILPFGEHAQKALKDYLLFSRLKLLKGNRGGPMKYKHDLSKQYLFLSRNGHQMRTADLLHAIKKYAILAGIEKNVGAHSFRHSCATHLLKNGADIRQIQQLLRHKRLDTTQIYTRVEITDLREAQKKHHPREN